MSAPNAVKGIQAWEEIIEAWAQNKLTDEPFTKLVSLVVGGAAVFYKAERGVNPKVNSYLDALVYVSTCASVGYGDIFAKTPAGKLIGAVTMTVGPAMANAALAGSRLARQRDHAQSEETQRAILEKLDQILQALKAQEPPAKLT